MSVSLQELWKTADDEAIVDAASKWQTLNEEGRRAVLAEAERRGLKLDVPSGNDAVSTAAAAGTSTKTAAATSSADSASAAAVNVKVWLLVAIIVAAVAAIAVFT